MTPEKLEKDSNPNPKTSIVVGNIYTLQWIHNSPSLLVPKEATRDEEAGGSGGGTRIASESPFLNCAEVLFLVEKKIGRGRELNLGRSMARCRGGCGNGMR